MPRHCHPGQQSHRSEQCSTLLPTAAAAMHWRWLSASCISHQGEEANSDRGAPLSPTFALLSIYPSTFPATCLTSVHLDWVDCTSILYSGQFSLELAQQPLSASASAMACQPTLAHLIFAHWWSPPPALKLLIPPFHLWPILSPCKCNTHEVAAHLILPSKPQFPDNLSNSTCVASLLLQCSI